MEYLTFLIALFYLLCYLPIWIANRRIKLEQNADVLESPVPVSLVIPFYNEEKSMASLILQLQKLNPPPIEILLIDDGSTDNSATLAKELTAEIANINTIINTAPFGKKQALTMAINLATQDTILCSDADCLYHRNWVKNMYSFHVSNHNTMTIGVVEYLHNGDWLSYYQWIESRALMAVGTGMFKLGYPIMCNGANLMFSKKVWETVGAYRKNMNVQGGDDIFLMHEFWKHRRAEVGICLDQNAVVFTHTTKGFKAFMQQRKRWASKTGKYVLPIANIYPVILALLNVVFIAVLVWNIILQNYAAAVGLLLFRSTIDYFTISSLKQGFTTCVSFVMVMQYQLFQLIYPFFLPFFKTDWHRKKNH